MSLKEWLEYINELLKTIAWPSLVLIAFLVLRKQIIKFIGNINEAELPGGIKIKAIDTEIKKAEKIKDDLLTERQSSKSKAPEKSFDPNKEMIKRGLDPSPSNLDMNYYLKILDQDPNIALAGLRIDLEIMVRNLAKGFSLSINTMQPIGQISNQLLNYGKITINQYKLINIVSNICNSAIHGQKVTKQQALQVFDIAPSLINDYISWLNWGFKNR